MPHANINGHELYITKDIMKDMGMSYMNLSGEEDEKTFYYSRPLKDNAAQSVKGYDYISEKTYLSPKQSLAINTDDKAAKTFIASLDSETNQISLKRQDNNETMIFDLANIINDKATDREAKNFEPIDQESKATSARLIVNNAQGSFDAHTGRLKIKSLQTLFLIKVK
jgi:hypothetical protein